jgi:hypothetical protein
LICFAGEYFYAKKGDKTTLFLAAVQPEMHPWDSSFAGFEMSYEGGIRYNIKRGVVGRLDVRSGECFTKRVMRLTAATLTVASERSL